MRARHLIVVEKRVSDDEQAVLHFDAGIGVITLNREDKMNAFGMRMREALYDCLLEVERRADCRAVIITGRGAHFTAGGDINEMQRRTVLEGRQRADILGRIFKKIVTLPQPVVCAIEGNCMGAGVSFAAAGDFAVAAHNSRFGVSQIKVGLLPDLGAIWSLPRKLGYRAAMEIAALGERFDAAEAQRIGLVNQLCEPGQALVKALEAAARFARNPPLAMALLKTAMNRGSDTVDQAVNTEADYQAMLYATQDHAEAARAFLEKRKPIFTGQ